MIRERLAQVEIDISPKEYEQVLPEICDAKISYVPESWTPDNPLCGACVPVSVVAQKIFGGKLLRADLKAFSEFRYMGWHWVNLLPGGRIKDFTRAQFGKNYLEGMEFVIKTPSSILRHSQVSYRVNLLYKRLLREIS